MDRTIGPADVHLFSIRGEYFFLDVEGNRLFAISPDAYQYLNLRISGCSPRNSLSLRSLRLEREISALLDSLQPLTAEHMQEKAASLEQEPCELFGLWLGLAHACNLGCRYCFANEPNYLQNHRPFMHETTAKRAVDFLLEKSPKRSDYDLIFFGGEPLLKFDLLQRVVEYTSTFASFGKKFEYSITTNGTLLSPDVYRYLVNHNVSIMLSIDGTKEVHNHNRPYRDGRPSWDDIVANIASLDNIGSNIIARVTITSTETPLVEIYENMRALGFVDIAMVEVCPNSGEMPAFPHESLPRWKEEYLELAEHVAENDPEAYYGGLQSLSGYMQSLRNRERSFYCCSTGISSLYVTPDEDLYPCMRLITDRGEHRIGNLESGVNMMKIRQFTENHIFNKKCKACWARYLCGGTCYGDAFSYAGDIKATIDTYCIMTQHKIHVAAYILKKMNDRALLPPATHIDERTSLIAKIRRLTGLLR
jgi:uncharacterized protein